MQGIDFENLFESFNDIRVAVLGDVMLDTYWWGQVERISPEAPVPVVALDWKEYRIGGAGNVALNLACLGAKVHVLSMIGDDTDGEVLTNLFANNNINTEYLLKNRARRTTSKSRIICRNQQMMRLDSEVTFDLPLEDEDRLLEKLANYITHEKPHALVLEDYNKGVLTERVIREAVSLCRENNVITSVDPKRKNFLTYQGVDIFKPNMKEVKEGLNLLLDDVSMTVLSDIHEQLREKLGHRISFITLSERGVFYKEGDRQKIVPSHFRNIADVSGAGDTVIAVASLIYAATRNVDLMARVANIAGGLVCEEVGTVAINKGKLLAECKELL